MTLRNFFRVGLLVAMLCAPGRAANDDRSMTALLPAGGIYPPGRWVPVDIKLFNRTAVPIDGAVSITPRGDDESIIVRRNVYVPAMSSLSVRLIGRFADQQVGKKQKVIDAATVSWTASNGSQRIDEPLTGLSDASLGHNGQDATGLAGVTVYSVGDPDHPDSRRDASEIAGVLLSRTTYSFEAAVMDALSFPRHAEELDAARLIAIDPQALRIFDSAQQQALITAVRGGATVLLSGPDAVAATSFLGPYLPLDVLGQHYVTALHPTGSTAPLPPLPLVKPVEIADVAPRDGAVVTLSDARGPLAAYLPLGFGRVAMTAFSAADLGEDPAAAEMWATLVGTDSNSFHEPYGVLNKPATAAILPQMIGATAPPWFVAAAVVGGYVAVVAVLLLVSGQGGRPMAMAVCVGIAVVLTGGLLGFTKLHTISQPLMVGRATLIDLAGNTARQQDIITFFGQQRDDLSIALPDDAVAIPAVTGGTPTLTLWPTKIANIGSSSGKLESVWHIERTYDWPQAISAGVQFGPQGATLVTDNATPQALAGTRLIVGGNVIPLPRVSTGYQEQPIGARNPPNVYADNASVLADEKSKLRTQLLELASTPPRTSGGLVLLQTTAPPPTLTGFLSSEPTFKLDAPAQSQDQTLLRAPLDLHSAAIGSTVRIDPAFTSLHAPYTAGMPYEARTSSWTAGNLTGTWLAGVAAPQQIGRVKPRQIALDIDARAGGYHLVIRRGQCAGDKVRENPAGEIVAEWNNQSARRTVAVDIAPNDIDANGWVWLRIDVTVLPSTGLLGEPSVAGEWQFMRFDSTITGSIDAAPQPVISTWPVPDAVTKSAARPKPKTIAKLAPTKPAAQSSAKPAPTAPQPAKKK